MAFLVEKESANSYELLFVAALEKGVGEEGEGIRD